jgi:hypothetical protein
MSSAIEVQLQLWMEGAKYSKLTMTGVRSGGRECNDGRDECNLRHDDDTAKKLSCIDFDKGSSKAWKRSVVWFVDEAVMIQDLVRAKERKRQAPTITDADGSDTAFRYLWVCI